MSIYQKGDAYGVDYRDEFGRRRRKLVGTQAAAEALAANLAETTAQGRQAGRNIHSGEALTTADAADLYIATKPIGERRREKLRQTLKQFAAQTGNIPVSNLTPQLIARWAEARAARVAPTTRAHENGAIKNLGKWLAENWYLPANPAKELNTAWPKQSSGRALSYKESGELLAQARTGNTRLKLLLAIDAGLRIGEALALKRNAWNQAEQTITVWSTKTKSFRTIPLTQRLAAAIEANAPTNPESRLIAGSKGATAATNFLAKRRSRGKATPRYHDLRHTFASRLAAATTKPHHVRILLGHAPRTNTDLYMHATPDELRESIRAMEAANPNAAPETKAVTTTKRKPAKEEEAMPGKRHSLRINGEKCGPFNGAQARPAENQDSAQPGTIILEVADEAKTKLVVALNDITKIPQPNPHAAK